MLIAISYPEVRVGSLRAVQYATSAIVYDDATDSRQAIWEETDLDAAKTWMESCDEYLSACKACKDKPSQKTETHMADTFFVLPPHSQRYALKLAKARNLL